MQKPAECTTILVGKDATIDGSTMIARSEDGGSTIIPEAFIAVNPKEQPKHYKAVISGQEIDDEDLLPNPLRYTSAPDASGKNGIWAAAGINDATVAMTATDTITSIASVAEQQSQASTEIARSVDDVHASCDATSREMAEAEKAVQDINRLSDALRQIVLDSRK